MTDKEIAGVNPNCTGIQVSKMLEGECEKLLKMEDNIHQRLSGRDKAC